MRKLLKGVGIAFGIVVVLLIGAVIVLPMLIDPNDYKDEITQLAREQTGRKLEISGPMSLSVFPWLAIEVSDVSLGNAPGFTPAQMLSVGRAEIRLKLIPLLRKEIVMDTVVLEGLRLNLAINKQGQSNWSDLSGPSAKTAPSDASPKVAAKDATPSGSPLAALAIGGLQIEDAEIAWHDGVTNQQWQFSQMQLETGPVSLEQPLDIQFQTHLRGGTPQLEGDLSLVARIGFDLASQRYQIRLERLQTELSGAGLPISPVKGTLAGEVEVDMEAQNVDISTLRLEALGAVLQAKLQAQKILDEPQFQGELSMPSFALEGLLQPWAKALGLDLSAPLFQQVKLETRFAGDLKQVKIPHFELSMGDAKLQVQAQVSNYQDPRVTGQLTLNGINPRELLPAIGQAVPTTADAKVLTQVSVETEFQGGLDHASLKKLRIGIDDSKLTGTVSFSDPQKPRISFDLQLDSIDGDRYLPPPKSGQATPKTKSNRKPSQRLIADAPIDLPVALLRDLTLDGRLRIGQLKVSGLQVEKIDAWLKGKGGKIELKPLTLQFYQGKLQTQATLDVRGSKPKILLDQKINGVQVGPLLADLLGEAKASGSIELTSQIQGQGLSISELVASLQGSGKFAFKQGAIKGVNLGQSIREAYATYKKQPAPPKQELQTDFSDLRGSFTVQRGVITNRDLALASPILTVKGSGTVNLPRERVNYTAKALISESAAGMRDLKGVPVPVHLKGSLLSPKVSVDMATVFKGLAKKAVTREVKKEKKRLKKKLEDRLKEKFKKFF